MKILKRLRDLKVMEDTLEGLEARKSMNKKFAFFFLIVALMLAVMSLCLMTYWVVHSMDTPAATLLMRAVAAIAVLALGCQIVALTRLCLNLVGKDPPLRFVRELAYAVRLDAYFELLVASFFTFVVFPHQRTDDMMNKYYNEDCRIERWYWHVVPSFYAKFFYFRTVTLLLTFSFTDIFVKESIHKEVRMREMMCEETVRSPPLRTPESTSDDGQDDHVLPLSVGHRPMSHSEADEHRLVPDKIVPDYSPPPSHVSPLVTKHQMMQIRERGSASTSPSDWDSITSAASPPVASPPAASPPLTSPPAASPPAQSPPAASPADPAQATGQENPNPHQGKEKDDVISSSKIPASPPASDPAAEQVNGSENQVPHQVKEKEAATALPEVPADSPVPTPPDPVPAPVNYPAGEILTQKSAETDESASLPMSTLPEGEDEEVEKVKEKKEDEKEGQEADKRKE